MHKHKAYKLTVKGRHLVYIPTLYKVYEVDSDQFETVPDFIESELPLPTGRWDNVKDFTFNGANLLLTNACNLRCVYCYEHAGDGIKMFMSNQIIDAAVHYMVNSALKSQMTGIHANMFGGEPTLAFNSLKYAVETMQSQANNAGLNCRVTITTNGVMSKEKAIWLAENMNSIMISMDGTKEIHDKQRSNSFDTAFANAKIIYNRIGCKKFAIRITVSDKNVMMIQETVDFFGTNFPGIKIALEPMFELGRGKEQSSKSPSEKLFFKGFIDALPNARKYGCALKTSILNLGAKTKQYCGVSGNNFMIGPDGTIASCNRMIFSDEPAREHFIFGRFDNDCNMFIFDQEKLDWLKKLTTDSVNECDNCFARCSCRGDCIANKAVLDPTNFWQNKSYRCQEIKDFISEVLLHVLDNSDSEIGG